MSRQQPSNGSTAPETPTRALPVPRFSLSSGRPSERDIEMTATPSPRRRRLPSRMAAALAEEEEAAASGDIASSGHLSFGSPPSSRSPASNANGLARIHEHMMSGSPGRTQYRIDDVLSTLNARDVGDENLDSIRGADRTGPRGPPSFAESQFATIIRRQRRRRIVSPVSERIENPQVRLPINGRTISGETVVGESSGRQQGEMKRKASSTGTSHDGGEDGEEDYDVGRGEAWEIAVWGQLSMITLQPEELSAARAAIVARPVPTLGQWRATSIAANAVAGSVFYSIPSCLAACGVLSPIALFVAGLLLGPFRGVIAELANTLHTENAGCYTYLSNSASRNIGLFAAAFTLMDAMATGAVSASTASSYLGATTSRLGATPITIILLVALSAICLLGTRGSSHVALAMIITHLVTMLALAIAGIVLWAKSGNGILAENWRSGLDALRAGKGVARAVFDGVCIAFVGLTGVETTPGYRNEVFDGRTFAKALRNLQAIVLLTEPLLALLVVATLDLNSLSGSDNVLAILAKRATGSTGRWLEVCVIVSATIVLAGGIITGATATTGVVDSLVRNRIIAQVFDRELPGTEAKWAVIILFCLLSLVMCATAAFNLGTLSSIFAITFLGVMALFPISLLTLHFTRPKLARGSRTPLFFVVLPFCIALAALAGNTALAPKALLQTAIYVGVLFIVLLGLGYQDQIAKIALWATQQSWLGERRSRKPNSRLMALRRKLISLIQARRKAPVIVFVSGDSLAVLIKAAQYVQDNEVTSHIIFVHLFTDLSDIPSEIESNAALADEAFERHTVELAFVEAEFEPVAVQAVSARYGVPLSRCFIGCPGSDGVIVKGGYTLADFGGPRIIM